MRTFSRSGDFSGCRLGALTGAFIGTGTTTWRLTGFPIFMEHLQLYTHWSGGYMPTSLRIKGLHLYPKYSLLKGVMIKIWHR